MYETPTAISARAGSKHLEGRGVAPSGDGFRELP